MDNVIASKLYRSGSIGYVSRSGGMSNELNNICCRNGMPLAGLGCPIVYPRADTVYTAWLGINAVFKEAIGLCLRPGSLNEHSNNEAETLC